MLKSCIVTLFIIFTFVQISLGQEVDYAPPSASINSPTRTNLWIGSYNKFRIGKKLIWDAQHHYRRGGYEETAFVGRMEQIYNRHAITYLVSPSFNATLGAVLRLNFTPQPGNDEFEKITLEPRIWHEYMFIMPFSRFMVYHRIRIEHRWSRNNRIGSDWIYRDRWRYKFYMNIPINKKKLIPGAFYFTPDIEIIMQTGKTIINNPLEDLRIYPQIGYILNPRIKYGLGLMYTTGQSGNGEGHIYNPRWVIRANMYLSLDFRKKTAKIPEIKTKD